MDRPEQLSHPIILAVTRTSCVANLAATEAAGKCAPRSGIVLGQARKGDRWERNAGCSHGWECARLGIKAGRTELRPRPPRREHP
jgi:hypothetical protein